MSRFGLRRLALVGPFAAVTALTAGGLPAFAQSAPAAGCGTIHFDLANPTAGTRLDAGSYVIQGVAIDSRALTGLGIDRVELFLDARDAGGRTLSTVVPGAAPGPFGYGSFQTTIDMPSDTGGHDLYAYAHSSVTGAESIIAVPIAVGEDPSKAGLTGAEQTMTSCTGGTIGSTRPAAPAAAATPAPVVSVPSAPAPTTTTASGLVLDVSNPAPGDAVKVGSYVMSGLAYDKGAPSGTGIDQLDIFLDDRDNGGTLLVHAPLGAPNWTTSITFPSNATGAHTLYVYAHSQVTGHWGVVTIPIEIKK